ncbi:uvrABC system protein C [Gracilaria domingensis]|nr:uvrABC system protein C [Gracilaria domingensis]
MEIPEELVLCTPTADRTLLETALSEKRGKKVVVKSKKGEPLARIVQRNADMEVNIERDRMHDAARDLRALEDLIKPYLHSLKVSHSAPGSSQQHSLQHHNALERIECFDISHTSGSNAVGSMAVFLNGSPCLSQYRRYNLGPQTSYQGHPDDYASLYETLTRRFARFGAELGTSVDDRSLPQLVIIDGGKGQLTSAVEALRALGLHGKVPLISIAKGEEAVFVHGEKQAINYDSHSGTHVMCDGVRLICRLRDEAHRTALMAHRNRRGRQALKSGLDSVSGLGPRKRASLLEHFNGSVEAVANALPNQLSQAPGIGPALADRLYSHFRHHTTGNSSLHVKDILSSS